MKFKPGDKVILPMRPEMPIWCYSPPQTSLPVWGGPQGYVLGIVQKICTHQHGECHHKATVKWTNGDEISLPESYIKSASQDELDVHLDIVNKTCPVGKDIWFLIKTSLGGFSLNFIDISGLSNKVTGPLYSAGMSRMVLPSINNSDYNLVSTMLSQPDWVETHFKSIFSAAFNIFETWGLPNFDALSLPVPTFPSIREAADSAPKEGPAVCIFHLPFDVVDYCDTPPRTI